ncbi:hypothetical protein DFH08DRAFT_970473 [Mycena albidolilacea]|uniref:PIN domain-containing protein n=1 Tax=Mycena albidolilacea TaxID=1033008 RepID=A0AAD6ZEW0_9AGAR|nr:hypothetical protein DFH08DRAFT_970473 [Mycena albidolilacea]
MADKKAMSRALGAAFLNHQVEQLEKSAASSGNWRNRTQGPQFSPKRAHQQPNNTGAAASKGAPRSGGNKNAKGGSGGGGGSVLVLPRDTTNTQRRSMDDSDREKDLQRGYSEKDADVVVVDASVLVHALHQVKRWCREGREEVVIVPLEALNTLDLLKKGTSQLAQRARAASRILEAQVGANPRIRVQRDDAFVPWDRIAFSASAPNPTSGSGATAPQQGEAAAAGTAQAAQGEGGVGSVKTKTDDPDPETAPEWVRRTVCCARWEAESTSTAGSAITAPGSTVAPAATGTPTADASAPAPARTVIFAVLAPAPTPSSAASPVEAIPNKHEPRAMGTLVAHWAARAGLAVRRVAPSMPNPNASASGGNANANANGGVGVAGGGGGGGGGRPRSSTGPGSGPQNKRGGGPSARPSSIGKVGGGSFTGGKGSLVERPAAALAMEGKLAVMEGKGTLALGKDIGRGAAGPRAGVVRVLARGERLDAGANAHKIRIQTYEASLSPLVGSSPTRPDPTDNIDITTCPLTEAPKVYLLG